MTCKAFFKLEDSLKWIKITIWPKENNFNLKNHFKLGEKNSNLLFECHI